MDNIHAMLVQAVDAHRTGNLPKAEELYRQVLTLDPNHPDALHLLGVMANQTGKPEMGIDFIKRALALQPHEPEFHNSLAAAFKGVGDVASAVAHYGETIRLKPDAVKAHIYLSDALMEQGRFDLALKHSLEALRLEPDSALAYCTLGELASNGHYQFPESAIAAMQTLVAAGQQEPRDASLLFFTLAAHWERQGDHREAFRCYRRANELKREVYRQSKQAFDPRKHRELIDRLIGTFTADLFERTRRFGSESEKPIFIVGMVRSGTSLVEQILASLPDVYGAGELRDVDQIAHALPRRLGTAAPYPACVTALDDATTRTLATLFLHRLDNLGQAGCVSGAGRVIDKMPHNYLHLGLISILFPRCRIIHCRRQMLDVCVAVYLQNFKWLPYASSLEEIGFYYRNYERLMEHWRRVLPLPVHEVVYEDLVANQEVVSRSLVAFCGLPWDERCLAFHKSPRTVQTSSKLQVRKPLYTHSLARWKRFEAYLKPLQDALADPDAILRQ
jgi:tetratricopeptide (TPR) repeat protein